MATIKSVRAGEFQPHADDMDALALMAGLRGCFKLNPRGQIYHLWFGERMVNEHIRLFARFPNLISVSAGVSWGKFKMFNDEGAIELAELPQLRCVELGGFLNLTNHCVQTFLKKKRILWLLLKCPNIDNRIMEHLPSMGHLVTLDLSHSGVTAESMPALKQLTNLRRLGLRKCGFTLEQITELAKALPKCSVVNEQAVVDGRSVG